MKDKIDFAKLVKSAEYDAEKAAYYGRKRVKNKKLSKKERKYKHKLYSDDE